MLARSWSALFLALAAPLLISCGGAGSDASSETGSESSSGSEATTDQSTQASTPSGPPRPWAEMSHEERAHYMAEVVTPEMRTMFQEHDAEEFADFGCRTCHGENAREVSFAMPNGLAPLSHDSIGAIFQSEHPGAVFMTQRVWPRMAQLLGEPLYNPETHQGFSCFDCHAEATGNEAH